MNKMAKHTCENCGNEFSQKSHYTNHKNRKNPCVTKSKLKEIISEVIEEKLQELKVNTFIEAPIQKMKIKIPKKIETNQPFTFIEVCAGGGGLSAGLIKAGLHPILLNDNNNCENYFTEIDELLRFNS